LTLRSSPVPKSAISNGFVYLATSAHNDNKDKKALKVFGRAESVNHVVLVDSKSDKLATFVHNHKFTGSIAELRRQCGCSSNVSLYGCCMYGVDELKPFVINYDHLRKGWGSITICSQVQVIRSLREVIDNRVARSATSSSSSHKVRSPDLMPVVVLVVMLVSMLILLQCLSLGSGRTAL
jgi:hypothetical protein